MGILSFLYNNVYKKIFGDPYGDLQDHIQKPPEIKKLNIGDFAPNFSVRGVDGKEHTLEDYEDKKVLVIVFSCNHCPFVKAYEDRLMAIQEDYKADGVVLIAINSNDEDRYPEESMKNMVIRSRAKSFNFPYLRDADQSIATAYGPERTPEVFLFDEERRLRYHGRIDDNVQEPNNVSHYDLRDAIEALIAGKEVTIKETTPIGCTVKWKLSS